MAKSLVQKLASSARTAVALTAGVAGLAAGSSGCYMGDYPYRTPTDSNFNSYPPGLYTGTEIIDGKIQNLGKQSWHPGEPWYIEAVSPREGQAKLDIVDVKTGEVLSEVEGHIVRGGKIYQKFLRNTAKFTHECIIRFSLDGEPPIYKSSGTFYGSHE